MIQEGMCSSNRFLFTLMTSKKLKYLKLESYLLLSSNQQDLFYFVAKNQCLKILHVALNSEYILPEMLKQLTEKA